MAVRKPFDESPRSPHSFTRMCGYVSVRKNSATVFKNSSICSYVFKMLRWKKKKKGVRVKTRIRPCRKLTVSIQVGNKHRSGNRRPMEIRYHSRRDRKATWGMSTDVCHQDPVPARWDLRRPAHWNECVALCLGEMGLRQRKAHLGKSWHLENFEYKEGKVLPAVGRVKR